MLYLHTQTTSLPYTPPPSQTLHRQSLREPVLSWGGVLSPNHREESGRTEMHDAGRLGEIVIREAERKVVIDVWLTWSYVSPVRCVYLGSVCRVFEGWWRILAERGDRGKGVDSDR